VASFAKRAAGGRGREWSPELRERVSRQWTEIIGRFNADNQIVIERLD
jgi:hypothetical protein